MPEKYNLAVVGFSGLIATLLAAMGSHAIPMSPEDAALFAQGSSFHFYHTLAIIGTALLAKWGQPVFGKVSMILFVIGIICFSGSLYWRAILGAGSLGSFHWITPIGGLLLMAGWFTLMVGALKVTQKQPR